MKGILRIVAVLLACALLFGVGYVADLFLGNPISKWQAREVAEAYLQEKYGDTDYEIRRIGYNFTMGEYMVYITSPTNIDVDFVLCINDGELRFDNYDRVVNSLENTKRRLNEEYRNMFNNALEGKFPVSYDVNTRAELLFTPLDGTTLPEDALLLEDLELNQIYDVRALGETQGYLDITFRNEVGTFERGAELLLEVKSLCDQVGMPFYAVNFSIFEPNQSSSECHVRYFLYEDIYEEGLAERLKKACEKDKAYWEQVFEEKEKKTK